MGGKGGGGGDTNPAMQQEFIRRGVDPAQYVNDVNYRNAFYNNNRWGPQYNSDGTLKAAAAPAPAAPAPAPAPAAAAPPPAAPVPDPGPPDPLGPAIDPGGAIDQPNAADNGLGNELGGSVLNPPQYWVGGLNKSEQANPQSGRDSGAMKVTQ